MEKSKDQYRKELVFQLLDNMKENGERINADKVAKLAQMGKQTILPYYNEWRFLANSSKDEAGELPVNVVRALQGLLVQWRHEVAEELNTCRAQSEQEIDDLKQKLEVLTEENNHLQQQLTETVTENEQLIKMLQDNQQVLLEREQSIKDEKTRTESREEIIASMKEQLQGLRQEHEALVVEQEEKLDQQYKLQIDHWMKVLDEERQQKQTVIKEQRLLQGELISQEKEKGSLENQLEHKTQAYIEACQERNELRQVLREQKSSIERISKISIIAAAEESELIGRIRSLLVTEQQQEKNIAELLVKENTIVSLEDQLKNNTQQEKSMQSLMMELEKSKGYAMALEKALGAMKTLEQK